MGSVEEWNYCLHDCLSRTGRKVVLKTDFEGMHLFPSPGICMFLLICSSLSFWDKSVYNEVGPIGGETAYTRTMPEAPPGNSKIKKIK